MLVSTRMRNSDKYCLKLSNFQENVKSTFGALRYDKEFVDVTLVCEDAFKIDCHKAILAMSSPFFNEILTKLKQSSPLIYLRGMREADLVAILDFIYFGEVNVLELLQLLLIKLFSNYNHHYYFHSQYLARWMLKKSNWGLSSVSQRN